MEPRPSPDPSPPGLLDVVGLDPDQEVVYRFVLSRGETSAAEAATAVRGDAALAAAALESVRSHGLISRAGSDGVYFPVDPRVAVRSLAERTSSQLDALRASIPALAASYERLEHERGPEPGILVVTGAREVGAWYSRIEHETQTEFLAFDRPPYVLAPHNPVQESVIARGVRWRAVYAAASLDHPGAWQEIRRSVRYGEEARIAPDLPVKLAISDRRIAIFATSDDAEQPEAVVAEARPVIAMLVDLFETTWERAADVPDDDGDDRVGAVRGPSAQDRAMLALFSAGAKDAVIARELGISPRTLRRRSSELLQRLGAANRFQAGAQAARRGWI